jgi:hypothetical protein
MFPRKLLKLEDSLEIAFYILNILKKLLILLAIQTNKRNCFDEEKTTSF